MNRKCSRLQRTAIFVVALLVVFSSLLYAPAAHGQAKPQGTWQTIPTTMTINPVHVALLANGKLLVVSGSGNTSSNVPLNAGIFDPASGTLTTQSIGWDMFCNGMVLLPDGRPFIMGGTLQYTPFFTGWNRTSTYDPATGHFLDMEDMVHGRWYPTSTVLSDGRVLTFSGADENGNTNSQTEIYTVGVGWSAPAAASWTPPVYPRMHLLPNGKVFYSGWTPPSRTFDPSTNTWSVGANTNYGSIRTYGSSVLLPLTPANGYAPKVIIFGGGNPATDTTEIIDLSATTPAWVYGPRMSKPRIEMNATLLPTGKVLTVGGSLNDEDASSASLSADLYDSASNTMGLAGSNAVPRLYHSVALLLPDATVWVAGGNPTHGSFQPSIEIYSPPYLFNSDGTAATRPVITSVTPAVIGYGTSFQVQTPDAANISSVVLMKNGAVTHAFDMEQRLVGLTFTQGSGVLNVTGPPTGNIAPPGFYMIFLINNSGVPSVAKFVQVSAAPTDIPPSGAITSPATDMTIVLGQSVSLAGSGAAQSGTITGYSWSIHGASPATSSLQNPGPVTFPGLGTYTAVLTVTDSAGVTDPSPKTRTITVTAGSPPTVASAIPNSGSEGMTNLNVVLSGSNFLSLPTCSFGAGIVVNSCTFNSSTQITANVNILSNATIGAHDVVVTDSDGQNARLAGGFSVTGGSGGGTSGSLTDTLVSDFSAGSGTNTYVSQMVDGEVIQLPTVGTEFSGTAIPSGWTANNWGNGGSAVVNGGTITVDGALVGTSGTYSQGRSLDFVATFTTDGSEHIGFGVDFNSAPWAIFSTGGGGGSLLARSNSGSGSQDIRHQRKLGGHATSLPHRLECHQYRVLDRWGAGRHPSRGHLHGHATLDQRLAGRRAKAGGGLDAPESLQHSCYVHVTCIGRWSGSALDFHVMDGGPAHRHLTSDERANWEYSGSRRDLDRLYSGVPVRSAHYQQ